MTSNEIADQEITILIMIDACRVDYLDHARFLKDLAPSSNISSLEGTFGFKSTTGGWAAGLYPEESNLYSIFSYSPETSPFGLFHNHLFSQSLKGFEDMLHLLFGTIRHDRLLYHSPAYLLRYLIAALMKRIHSNPLLTLAEIPYDILPYFDIAETRIPTDEGYLMRPTVFEILKEHGRTWLYHGEPVSVALKNQTQVSSLRKVILRNRFDFVFLHITDLDPVGHLYGPGSKRVHETVRSIDRFIEELHGFLVNRYETVNTIIFSDHGMVEVKKRIDIRKKIEELPVELGRDYVMFLDSPSARFWFANDSAEELIIDELSKSGDGRMLTPEDYRRFGVRFGHRKYWDRIFLANPGVLIFPNFFQGRHPVRGMHGYDTSHGENQGVFLAHTTGKKIIQSPRLVRMVDIFPTVLDLMELPVPHNSGVSLIRAN